MTIGRRLNSIFDNFDFLDFFTCTDKEIIKDFDSIVANW